MCPGGIISFIAEQVRNVTVRLRYDVASIAAGSTTWNIPPLCDGVYVISAPPSLLGTVTLPTRGRNRRTRVPAPHSLSIPIAPPRSSANRRTSASPTPVPVPGAFVVKYGVNARDKTSSVMPSPSSATTISMNP
jgi:hypothetical protein